MKPDYAVPTMTEIEKLRGSNGYKVISTFSGCGGSCLGLEMAGYEVLYASEFVQEARETYALNHPGVHIDPRDIRDVTPDNILEITGLAVGEIDLLEGSPPCASFSTAGKREQDWGKVKSYSETSQRADDLFFEYARLVEGLQPKAFVAENVSGLIKGSAKGYFKMILAALQDCGYQVEAKLLDSSWLGVPQVRKRLIFQGIRNDLNQKPRWPRPLDYRYTIRDACPWITNHGIKKKGFLKIEEANGNTAIISIDKPSDTVTAGGLSGSSIHQAMIQPPAQQALTAIQRTIKEESAAWYEWLVANGHPEAPSEEIDFVDIRNYAIGREWLRLRRGNQSSKYFNLVRADANQPVGTITQTAGVTGAAGVTHPSEPRKFTIPEVRRLCSFPDDFELTGTFRQRWERLGRSVPPLMMRAVGSEIRNLLDETNE